MNLTVSTANALLPADFCHRLTLTLAHFLWQGLLIALAVHVLLMLLNRWTPQVRYAVGTVGLLLMAACPPATWIACGNLMESGQSIAESDHSTDIGTTESDDAEPVVSAADRSRLPGESAPDAIPPFELPDPADDSQLSASITLADSANRPQRNDDSRTPAMVRAAVSAAQPAERSLTSFFRYSAGCYLAGVMLMALRLAGSMWNGHRLRIGATAIEDSGIVNGFRASAERLEIKRVPLLAWSTQIAVPLAAGILRPVVLLPVSISTGLAPAQLEALLIHELAHIRRGDLFVNLLQRLIETVLFFHPAVWWLSRHVSREREDCCDDIVLATGGDRLDTHHVLG